MSRSAARATRTKRTPGTKRLLSAAGAASLSLGLLASLGPAIPALAAPVVISYDFTGTPQLWAVPAGVTEITVSVLGAAGGRCGSQGYGGLGGQTDATLSVTPGDILQITVGGEGDNCSDGGSGGFNGGGNGGKHGNLSVAGAGGGGASDIRAGSFSLAERVIVAGGGGGGATASRRAARSAAQVPEAKDFPVPLVCPHGRDAPRAAKAERAGRSPDPARAVPGALVSRATAVRGHPVPKVPAAPERQRVHVEKTEVAAAAGTGGVQVVKAASNAAKVATVSVAAVAAAAAPGSYRPADPSRRVCTSATGTSPSPTS